MNHYNLDYIEPTVEAQEKFSTQLIEDLKTTVWVSGGCVSWYQHKNGVRQTPKRERGRSAVLNFNFAH